VATLTPTCLPEVCKSRSTGIDSGRSQHFSTGAGIGPGVGFLIGTLAGAGVILSRVFLTFRCIFAVYINYYTGLKQEQESMNFV